MKQKRNTYGGEITLKDFNTSRPYGKRIDNQATANAFIIMLDKLYQEKKYKNMPIEKLRELNIISNTDGRPTSTLTDKKWQNEFRIRKLLIKPVKDKFMKTGHIKETGITYIGATNYQRYCSYINDILRNIRTGQVDYCYYIYQIMDLLKFHHDDLRTKYCDGYWEVWLERECTC